MSREPTRPTRVLVTGWFSFVHGEATAGDLLAGDAVRAHLREAGIEHEVARSPVLGGPSLEQFDPDDYSHVVFVCGPAAGWQVEELLTRFAGCVKVAVGVSVVPGTPDGFDTVISRDGIEDRPDLSLLAGRASLPPVVGLVRTHPQGEYPAARPDEAHEVVEQALHDRDVAVLELDTRVDPREVVGRRAEEVEATLARMDAVVTTRMHGLVLALKHGVPAVAVDVVPGGAKVSRQADVLGWPALVTADDLTRESLLEALDWALGDEARGRARRSASAARDALGDALPSLLSDALRVARPSLSRYRP